jgi:hypothetical protein
MRGQSPDRLIGKSGGLNIRSEKARQGHSLENDHRLARRPLGIAGGPDWELREPGQNRINTTEAIGASTRLVWNSGSLGA